MPLPLTVAIQKTAGGPLALLYRETYLQKGRNL